MTTTRVTKAKLVSRCKELGVMLLDDGDALTIDAPVGYVVAGLYFHSTVHAYGPDDGRPKSEAYENLYADLEGGLERCEDADCDSCVHEPKTFDEIHKLYRGERLA